jgi:hypothetical protein
MASLSSALKETDKAGLHSSWGGGCCRGWAGVEWSTGEEGAKGETKD